MNVVHIHIDLDWIVGPTKTRTKFDEVVSIFRFNKIIVFWLRVLTTFLNQLSFSVPPPPFLFRIFAVHGSLHFAALKRESAS